MRLTMLDRHRTDTFVYCNPTSPSDIMKQFSDCRLSNRFIDLQVEVKGVIFPCHQILLDAVCPYFSAYFSFSSMKSEDDEGLRGVQKVSLKYDKITVQGFSILLHFIYNGELEVTVDNVIDVLHCAHFLQFHEVIKTCAAFLLQHIAADTCLHVLVTARALGLPELEEKAFGVVLSHLTDVMCLEEFTNLSKDELVKIISHPHLELKTEVTVVNAIMTWIKGGENQRCPLLKELLQHVHPLHSHLEELRQDKLLMDTLKEMVLEEGRVIMDADEHNKDSLQDAVRDYLMECSTPYRLTAELVVVCDKTECLSGNKRRVDMRQVYCYSAHTQRWQARTVVPFTDRESYSVAVVDNRMHITGGRKLDDAMGPVSSSLDSHVLYDPKENKWHTRQCMLAARCNHSSAALGGQLYVVGGGYQGSDLVGLRADGEVYDYHSDQWSFISPVRNFSGIGNPALVSLHGKLYCLGGVCKHPDKRRGNPVESHVSAQMYDPDHDLWYEVLALEREISSKNLHPSRGKVIAADGLLILINEGVGKSHSVYNPVSQSVAPLVQAHGHHWLGGWALFQGQLLSIGGMEGQKLIATDMVHRWDLTDPMEHTWHMMPSLPVPMYNHRCVTLHFPQPGPVVASDS